MDSDVRGSSNPGPEEGEPSELGHGTDDPAAGGTVPEHGSGNPGPAEPKQAQEPEEGSDNPGPEE